MYRVNPGDFQNSNFIDNPRFKNFSMLLNKLRACFRIIEDFLLT